MTGGHHALGFSTIEAYALERCERSSRWVQESRTLVRRLAELPMLAHAVRAGQVTFSMAQVIAKIACADDEERWLTEAKNRTVRGMRALVEELIRAEDDFDTAPSQMSAEEKHVTLTLSVDREDAWLFECARMIAKQHGENLEGTLDALLAEGTTALLATIDRDAMVPYGDEDDAGAAQRAWRRELARFREQAELRCESGISESSAMIEDEKEASKAVYDWAGDAEHIDAVLRQVAKNLARRDLLLGELAERFWRADGWRRLGFATEAQYARERLGMSLSSVKAKRALSRRARSLTRLEGALANGELGYEAARLVASVASKETQGAWVERARTRTVKHLREEVEAVQMLHRLALCPHMDPPTEQLMTEVAALERRIVTGQTLQPDESQMSAAGRARWRSRVTLKFRVTEDTYRYFRWLEEAFGRHGLRSTGFLRYLCVALIEEWQRAPERMAYSAIYERDCWRCTSPVCSRRDVTPHHLEFRSAGGNDSAENVTSLCVWCHLEGVHRGALGVDPPSSAMTWRIGRNGHTRVRGRERSTASARG
jgi:hypothetical protein